MLTAESVGSPYHVLHERHSTVCDRHDLTCSECQHGTATTSAATYQWYQHARSVHLVLRPVFIHSPVMAIASPVAHSSVCTTGAKNNGHPALFGNDDGGGIPVVDFDVLVNGAADKRSQAVRDLGRACEDWGFFMVINHGVPEDLKEEMVQACKELFGLPEEEKAEHLEAEPMAPIRIGSGFYSVVDGAQYWRNYLKMFAHPELHCPGKPAKLRDVAAEYSAKTRNLLLQLAKAISESLGLDGGRISNALNLDACFQILVGNHYPAYTGPGDLGVGLPAHSDHGLLTLLFQDGANGLQVEHGEQWILAKPLPGAFFVIAGDQMEIVSNGRYKAAIHRAVIGGEQERMSIVSMVSPSMDTVVEPVPELAREGRGLEFRGVRYRDYMAYQQSIKLEAKEALNMARVQPDDTTGHDLQRARVE